MREAAGFVEGFCTPRFEPLRRHFVELIESGQDLGASLAVTVDGEFALDLWGGWSDEARTQPWQRDTITCVFSTTKTMLALGALVLVERGQLDLDAPVARYWPEFAVAGKSSILVRHILSHTSGLSGWEEPVTFDDTLHNWDKCTALLAAQEPWWTPGTVSGYHSYTMGFLVGELVRRITGRRFGRFFAEEIAGPLAADFHIGLARSEFGRVSDPVPWPQLDVTDGADPGSVAHKTMTNGPPKDLFVFRDDAWRQADLPAANGYGNARSVARLQSLVANGGEVGEVRLLSPNTIASIFQVQAEGRDLVIGVPLKMGIGYALPQHGTLSFLPEGRICTWGGAGGSFVIVDVDRRMTLAYVMNKMVAALVPPNMKALITRFYEIVGG